MELIKKISDCPFLPAPGTDTLFDSDYKSFIFLVSNDTLSSELNNFDQSLINIGTNTTNKFYYKAIAY